MLLCLQQIWSLLLSKYGKQCNVSYSKQIRS
jgi:hypothetical protein